MKFLLSSISTFVGLLTRIPLGAFSELVLKIFASLTKINLTELPKEIRLYKTVDEFFTRELKAGSRIVKDGIVSPCDGAIRLQGEVFESSEIIVKGTKFIPESLIQKKGYQFKTFSVLYLSPKDYHRVHVPFEAELINITHIPGKLYPVNSIGHFLSKRLYETNERVVFHFRSESIGEYFLVMVGALNVGKISYIIEDGSFVPISQNASMTLQRSMKKGEQLGVFHLGSSVVLLFPEKYTPIKSSGSVTLGETLLNL